MAAHEETIGYGTALDYGRDASTSERRERIVARVLLAMCKSRWAKNAQRFLLEAVRMCESETFDAHRLFDVIFFARKAGPTLTFLIVGKKKGRGACLRVSVSSETPC